MLRRTESPINDATLLLLTRESHWKIYQVDLQEGFGRDERTILKWSLKKLVSLLAIGLIRLRIGTTGEPFQCGIEPPGFINHVMYIYNVCVCLYV